MVAALALLATVFSSDLARAETQVRQGKAQAFSTPELWRWAAGESDVVLLARVLAPARTDSLSDTASTRPFVAVRLEPVEYLKGGLEGEEIEVIYEYGDTLERGGRAMLAAIAGRDTIGAVFFLKHREQTWVLPYLVPPPVRRSDKRSTDPALEVSLREGFVPVSQRHFKARVDQLRKWFKEDSTMPK